MNDGIKLYFKRLTLLVLVFGLISSIGTFSAFSALTDEEINRLLVCYKRRLDEKRTSEKKYDLAFQFFPKESFYKLFIDQMRLAHPEEDEVELEAKYLFDQREPGYHDSMMNAFSHIRTTLDQKIDLNYILLTHDLAVGQIEGMQKGITTKEFSYDLHGLGKLRSKGLAELVNGDILHDPIRFIQGISESPCFGMEPLRNSYELGLLSGYHAENCISVLANEMVCPIHNELDRIQPHIDYFYSQISGLTSLWDKLSAISELLRTLEVAHFLPDGNQRTYAFLILNKLLIQNGIPPVILDDPYMFDGPDSLPKMAELLKRGIYHFLNENEEGQRVFLREYCTEEVNPDTLHEYLKEELRHYVPRFKVPGISASLQRAIHERILGQLRTATDPSMMNVRNSANDRMTPLDRAIILGSISEVNRLLHLGADPFLYDWDSSFMRSLSRGNLKLAQVLLDFGISQATTDAKKKVLQGQVSQAINWVASRSFTWDEEVLLEPSELLSVMDQLLSVADSRTLARSRGVLESWAHMEDFPEEARSPSVQKKFLQILVKHGFESGEQKMR